MNQSLLLSALGNNRAGLLESLVRQISQCGCSITDSRATVLNGVLLLVARLDGPWDALARLETTAVRLERELDLSLELRRVKPESASEARLPYSVDIVGRDHPGTLAELVAFFQAQGVAIAEVVTQSYVSDHTDTPMATVQLTIHIPDTLPLAGLRENFLDLCDRLNLDGIMEPIKH
jgi:glycine cleavage system transcriptional repressor